MKIFLIIPNFNGKKLLAKCLASVFAEKINQLSVIVVDNGSEDGSVEWLKKHYPQVAAITFKKNLGFAKAVNRGISEVLKKEKNGWIVLLNNDAWGEKNWLKALIEFLKKNKNKKFFAQSLILKKDKKTLDSAGGKLLPKGKVELIKFVPHKPQKIEIVSATAVAYPLKFFQDVGLFDERFGSYLEDVDLSLRAKKFGWQGWVVPFSRVIHQGQATSQKMGIYKEFCDFKNWWLILFKHYSIRDIVSYFPQIIVERMRNLWGLVKKYGKII